MISAFQKVQKVVIPESDILHVFHLKVAYTVLLKGRSWADLLRICILLLDELTFC